MQNAYLHTEDRVLRTGKSTKQIAHKLVLSRDIQSLMNTTLVFNEKKKTLYEGGLGPGTLEPQKCLTKFLPLDYERTQVDNSNLYIYIYIFIHCCEDSWHKYFYN